MTTGVWRPDLSRREALLLGGGLVSTSLLSACGGGSGDRTDGGGAPQRGGTLTFAWNTPVYESLDPHKTQDPATYRYITPLYSKLLEIKTGPNVTGYQLTPDLAREWTVSKDGLTYTFHLRDDVVWHDLPPVNGRGFTSDDVVATFQRIMRLPGDNAWMFERVASVEAPDKYTVVVKLKKRYGPFLEYMAHPWNVIIPREGAEGRYDLGKQVIGTGPFVLKSWSREEEMTRVRNPRYFIKGRPYLDELNHVVLAEPAAVAAALRSGRVDMGVLDHRLAAELTRGGRHRTYSVLNYPQQLNLNTQRPPFDDLRVRRAVALAVDWDGVGKTIFGKYQLSSIVTPASGPYALPPDQIRKVRPYDPAQARRLLAEAGLGSGFGTEMIVQKLSPSDVQVAEYMAQDLKKVGINVTLRILDTATAVQRRLNGQFTMAKSMRGLIHYDIFLSDLEPDARLNVSRIKDPRLGEMIEASRDIVDDAKRAKAVQDIARYAEQNNSAAIYPLCTYQHYVHGAHVHDLYPSPEITGRYWADVWVSK
ncbi:ABC transporter substrate-binding protein [Actinomadura sp. NBRC 104412]|uniref:ABC transporter substrate-binding protein n=1 Tax=Actinomadura sp. NBRC 104412 TaxID=3032203 RepID=UPI0025522AB0|nr:ABC transporter substrate-binding protein [Actinomadura sp. NBRC 104412]